MGDLFPTPVGMRLRAAREARGLSVEQLSRLAHLPSAVLADIEADRLERLGAPVYVRGYLRSYARVVGVPESVVDAATASAPMDVPPLVATVAHSRSRALAARSANLLAYALLTAVVVVPLVMFARPERREAPPLRALDEIPASDLAPSAVASGTREPGAAAAIAVGGSDVSEMGPPAEAIEPVRASMAPVPSATPVPQPSPVPIAAAPDADDAGGRPQRVVLELAQPSWVELVSVDGRRIEYALLPAGTVREYQVAGTAHLRIGNSRGARLLLDGAPVDLAAHSRSNVARVALGNTSPPR